MNRLPTTLIALACASLAQAAEPAKAEPAQSTASSVATKTGNAIKKGATTTAEVVGTTVGRTKEGVKKGATKTGHAIEKGAQKVKAALTPASASN